MEKAEVTSEQFSRYADLHLGSFKCEVCGVAAWQLLIDPSIATGPISLTPGLTVTATCVVSCKNCGNMKYFLREHVETWLERHPVDG